MNSVADSHENPSSVSIIPMMNSNHQTSRSFLEAQAWKRYFIFSGEHTYGYDMTRCFVNDKRNKLLRHQQKKAKLGFSASKAGRRQSLRSSAQATEGGRGRLSFKAESQGPRDGQVHHNSAWLRGAWESLYNTHPCGRLQWWGMHLSIALTSIKT